MKHEALLRSCYAFFDTAWMPEEEREEYFQRVAPELDRQVDACKRAGATDEEIMKIMKLAGEGK